MNEAMADYRLRRRHNGRQLADEIVIA